MVEVNFKLMFFRLLCLYSSVQFSSVQSLSCVQLFATPGMAAHQDSLSITNSRSLPKLMSTESVMPSNHLFVCCSLLLPPSIFPSTRVFSNESVLWIRWPKYWSFSFNIRPSSELLISFRMDGLDLLAVQGTLKSLLQHHRSKASILWRSAFFIVQLSHPYMTTGKTIRSDQSLSRVRLFATPWIAARQASLSITNFWTLLKLMSTELVMPSNHPILRCPLLLPPFILSQHQGLF